MFRSPTIVRELALNLAKVIFMLKHSVKLRRYLLCGCVAASCHTTASSSLSTCTPGGHLQRVTIPDAVLI